MYTIKFTLKDNNVVTWYYEEEHLRPSVAVLEAGLTASRFINCKINSSIINSDSVIHVDYDNTEDLRMDFN